MLVAAAVVGLVPFPLVTVVAVVFGDLFPLPFVAADVIGPVQWPQGHQRELPLVAAVVGGPVQ